MCNLGALGAVKNDAKSCLLIIFLTKIYILFFIIYLFFYCINCVYLLLLAVKIRVAKVAHASKKQIASSGLPDFIV